MRTAFFDPSHHLMTERLGTNGFEVARDGTGQPIVAHAQVANRTVAMQAWVKAADKAWLVYAASTAARRSGF